MGSLTKQHYLERVLAIYPSLFDPGVHQCVHGPCLYLADQSVTRLPFTMREYVFGFVKLVATGHNNILNLSLNIDLLDSEQTGRFNMFNDLKLSDKSCFIFSHYGICIDYSLRDFDGEKIIEYDMQGIKRRYTIKNIINA